MYVFARTHVLGLPDCLVTCRLACATWILVFLTSLSSSACGIPRYAFPDPAHSTFPRTGRTLDQDLQKAQSQITALKLQGKLSLSVWWERGFD
jgi:hypothetical protein